MSGSKNNDTKPRKNDEFQDALTGSPAKEQEASKLNDQQIDELVEESRRLELPDDDADDTNKKTEECEARKTTSRVTPEYLDDIIDEQALLEREKTMTAEELACNKEKTERMKLDGNEHFKNGDAMKSIGIYTEALNICPTTCTKERAVLYGNRAAAKIKIDSKKSAIDDCSKAIELWPDYVRVLLRRAKLYELDDKLDEALRDYKRVYELDPGQREAREAIVRLPPIIDERNERLKTEMLSNLKDLGNMILKPFGLSTSNFKMQQDPNTGSYSINFNQNAS